MPVFWSIVGFLILMMGSPVSCMDVTVTQKLNALNGSQVKLSCSFISCYKVDTSKFTMNWTYTELPENTTKILFMRYHKHRMLPEPQEKFGNRVAFVGNVEKNDLSITISDVQLSDDGYYNCSVRNPPDRVHGTGIIKLNVLTELPPPRDSTIAVAIGASVGGVLALLILSMVVVKCIRRKQKQEPLSDEQKTDEEAKTDGEGGAEEGTKKL